MKNGKKNKSAGRDIQSLWYMAYFSAILHTLITGGRIPGELEKNGASIYYGNHNSAAAVDDSAKELIVRIKEVLKETGAEKVNVIAHSKGGLDMRTAIQMGGAPYVASLTTVNTPHRGCEFADYLLGKIPNGVKDAVAKKYNTCKWR